MVGAAISHPAITVAADLWDSRPLSILQTTPANFPPALASRGVTQGEVRAILHVDLAGKLLDHLILAYTAPELAAELNAAIRDWEFEPARQRGEPIGARSEVTFSFEARGLIISVSGADAVRAGPPRLIGDEMISLVCRAAELDEPLRAVHTVPPRHPGKQAPASPRPAAVVDFYIDGEGRPRLPVVTRAAHELYAVAALDALLQWQFAPPRRRGQPVIVRATQIFAFSERS